MGKVGLIAGAGTLPLEFVRSAKESGDQVIVFALNGMASPQLEKEADKVYWLNIGQIAKFAFLMAKERIRKLALLGKVEKKIIYEKGEHDEEYRKGLKRMKNKKDYSILAEITKTLGKIGVEVIDGLSYLAPLMPQKGVLTRSTPDEQTEKDIKFGYDSAKKLAGMDIGQTVIVKESSIVAVEAMEGTDATIERASSIAGENCVMVKVSRPDQDFRWDIPAVGPDTMTRLVENKYKALAIEADRMFLIEREKVVEMADSAGIVIVVI